MRFIVGLSLIILLSSCATTTTNYYQQTVQSWHGGDANTLIKRWGAPDRRTIGPDGNSLYLYQTQSYRNLNTPSSPSIGVNFNAEGHAVMTTTPNTNMAWNRGAMSYSCVTAFEVAKNGTILNTSIQGSSCYGNESFASRMKNPMAKNLN
jgi:hypothetical protein